MFSAEDYLQGWIVYSIGASCLLLFLWLVRLDNGSPSNNAPFGSNSADSRNCLS